MTGALSGDGNADRGHEAFGGRRPRIPSLAVEPRIIQVVRLIIFGPRNTRRGFLIQHIDAANTNLFEYSPGTECVLLPLDKGERAAIFQVLCDALAVLARLTPNIHLTPRKARWINRTHKINNVPMAVGLVSSCT
jgi:hypothetical protein